MDYTYLNCPVCVNTFGGSRENVWDFVKGLYGEFELNTDFPIPIKPEF